MSKPTFEELEQRVKELEEAQTNCIKAEKILIKSEAHLRTLIETIPDLVWLKDLRGTYLGCNEKFELFFGAKEADIIGKTDYDFVDKELADLFRENDIKAMILGKPSMNEEEVTFAADGHHEFLETIKTPLYDSDRVLIGVLGIARDITKRKKAMEEKEKLINKLEKALQEVKTLRGFIPICAKCKKIRNDEGYWQQIESYISQRTEAEFSHDICNTCAKELFPEINLDDK